MANILGKLLVELGINTAAFKEGLDKATYKAKAAAAAIKDELGKIGEGFAKLGDMFGELPLGMGTALSGLQKGIASLGEAAGPIGSAVAAVGAAVLGVAAGAVALTVRAAEAADKIYLLSQATGVSVPVLSGLAAVAKTANVDLDSLAKGLERLNRSAFAAATGPAGAATAYTRLHISVKDANGQVKSTETLFSEVANKFSDMEDGAAKTALAMQIFGRTGANLIPILNKGGDEINALMADAKALGAVLTEDAAEAAHRFEESITRLQLAGEGLQNKLMTGLAPVLETVANQIVDALKDSQSGVNDFINGVVSITKYTIEFFEVLVAVFHQLGIFFGDLTGEIVQIVSTSASAIDRLIHGDVKGAWEEIKVGAGGAKAIFKQFVDDSSKMWSDFADTTAKLFSEDKITPKEHKKKKTVVDTGRVDKGADTIESKIKQLEAQADAEGKLAVSIQGTVSATIQATAAAKADLEIGKLEAEAVKLHTKVTDEQKERIREATLRMEAYKAALSANKNIEQAIVKTREHISVLQDEAQAYGQGAVAISLAQEKAKLTPYIKQVDDLQQAYDDMAASGKFTTLQLAQLKTALEGAKQKLVEETEAIHKENVAKQQAAGSQYAYKLGIETVELGKQITATLAGADALRRFNAERQVAAFIRDNPFLTPEQVAQLRASISQISAQETTLAAAQKVAAMDRRKDLDAEILQLQKLRTAAVAAGKDTLAYDAAIHQAEQQKIKDYANELLATGKLGAGAKAYFVEFVNNARITGQKIHDLFQQAFDGINQNLAETIVKGTADWRGFFQDLEIQIAKMVIEWVEAKIIMLAFGKLLGDDQDEQKKKQISSNAMQASSAAGLAAANTLALTSAVYLPPAPEALAGLAYGVGMGFASMAAFDHGGIVSDDMIANVHKDEMVLPPDIARHVMNTAGGRNPSSNGGNRPISIHLSHSVTAMDSRGVHEVIQAEMPAIVHMIGQEIRRHNV